MGVRLYLDVHVPRAIADQLQRRGVDVITAIEVGLDALADRDSVGSSVLRTFASSSVGPLCRARMRDRRTPTRMGVSGFSW
jgi:hypothetical protein